MNLLLALYALIAAATCGVVALVELLYRYPHSTKLSAILSNWPAIIYISINIAIGLSAVLAANSMGLIAFDLLATHPTIPDIFNALGAGAVGLGLLRSSVATFKNNESESNIGMVEFLDKIREMLDRKIALAHKIYVDQEVAAIMKGIDAERARYELPALCLVGINSCTEQDVADMRAAVDKIFRSDAVKVRHLLLGHALHEFCGLEVLRSSVKQTDGLLSPLRGTINSDNSEDVMAQLANEFKRLKENGK